METGDFVQLVANDQIVFKKNERERDDWKESQLWKKKGKNFDNASFEDHKNQTKDLFYKILVQY
jgi:hypothetical protein